MWSTLGTLKPSERRVNVTTLYNAIYNDTSLYYQYKMEDYT